MSIYMYIQCHTLNLYNKWEKHSMQNMSIKNPLVLHRITQLLFFDLLSKILLLVQLCQPDPHSIRVRLQPFPLS